MLTPKIKVLPSGVATPDPAERRQFRPRRGRCSTRSRSAGTIGCGVGAGVAGYPPCRTAPAMVGRSTRMFSAHAAHGMFGDKNRGDVGHLLPAALHRLAIRGGSICSPATRHGASAATPPAGLNFIRTVRLLYRQAFMVRNCRRVVRRGAERPTIWSSPARDRADHADYLRRNQ